MKKWGWGLVLGLLASSAVFAISLPAGCQYDKECLINVPGAVCADGTPSFVGVTVRRGAPNLLVYMNGGGACWDRATCKGGMAKPLTRVEETVDWNSGEGIYSTSDSNNPFARGFSVARIPYCTGDVFSGENTADYSDNDSYLIRHVGYKNVLKSLDYISEQFPKPGKAVLLGCSAGGIGVYYHLRNFANVFPDAQKYVVSDAGTPFKPPHISPVAYQAVLKIWGTDKTWPVWPNGNAVAETGELIRYNTKFFPDVRFGFLSSYEDEVMTFFAKNMGAPNPKTAVRTNIIDVADNDIGIDAVNQQVFFLNSTVHCHTGRPLGQTVSLSHDLGTWLKKMIQDKADWKSVRPDMSN